MTHAAITVTRDYLKANPELVKSFLQAYIEGWQFATNRANQDAMVKSLAKWTKTDEPTAKASYEFTVEGWAHDKVPSVSEAGIQTIMSLVDNPKVQQAKPSDFYDNSLIEAGSK